MNGNQEPAGSDRKASVAGLAAGQAVQFVARKVAAAMQSLSDFHSGDVPSRESENAGAVRARRQSGAAEIVGNAKKHSQIPIGVY